MLSPDITPREQKKRGKENTKCALQDSFGTASFLQEKKKRRKNTTITKINAVKGQYRSIIAKEVT